MITNPSGLYRRARDGTSLWEKNSGSKKNSKKNSGSHLSTWPCHWAAGARCGGAREREVGNAGQLRRWLTSPSATHFMTILCFANGGSRVAAMTCLFSVAFGGVRAEATLYAISVRLRPDPECNAFKTEGAGTVCPGARSRLAFTPRAPRPSDAITPQSPVPIPIPQLEIPVSNSRDHGVIWKADAESRRPFRVPGPVVATSCDEGSAHRTLGRKIRRGSYRPNFAGHQGPFSAKTLASLGLLAPPGLSPSCER